VVAGSDYIVTGDKDLLRLGTYDSIKILTVSELPECGAGAAAQMPMRSKFVEPMLLLRTKQLPGARNGVCALAIKIGGKVQLRSRNDNEFSLRYPAKCFVEAERLECLLFLSYSTSPRGLNGDEPPVFEDACPVFCPKSIFAFVSRIDGGKGYYGQ
jgi:hypothetical protein